MNINSILDGINLVTRGRFSAKSGAAWVKWMGFVLSRVENECPGVGSYAKVSAMPMDSGFIPNPPGIKQITGLFIDDEEIKYDRNHLGIWPMFEDGEEKKLTSQSRPATLTAEDPKSISIEFHPDYLSISDGDAELVTANASLIAYSGTIGTMIVPSEFWSVASAGLAGFHLKITGQPLLVIATSTVIDAEEFNILFETTAAGIDAADTQAEIIGLSDEQFSGWSAVAGRHQIELFKSEWLNGVEGSYTKFSASRKVIGQTFAQTDGYIFTSNVKIAGYSSIQRPTTLTEEINLDSSYEQMLADGLYMFAERDSDPSSNEAVVRTQIFEQSLKLYRIDQTQAAFKSAPKKFISTPRLGARNRGW